MNNLRTFFIISLFCFCNKISAQEIDWQNTIGGSGTDYFSTLTLTSNGGVIVGGYSGSNISVDKTEDCIGSYDFWIVKLNSEGAIQWQNTIGGTENDVIASIAQTFDGGYVLAGYSNSNISGDKTENNQGSITTTDFWVIKLDSLGNIQWQNTIGGSLADRSTSVRQTSDGGYIIGGYSISNISGDKTENSQGSFDYWVIKLDNLGTIEWENTIGGTGIDQIFSIIQTSDGGFVLGGDSNSSISGDKSEDSQGGADYWIVKLDFSGLIQWQNTIGGSGEESLRSISPTYDGGYILGGFSKSNISGDKSENNQGNINTTDYWVVKLDSLGNIQWQNTIGGNIDDELNSISQTFDGGYIIGGISESDVSADKTENNIFVGEDYWIVKIDSSGNIQWQNTIGGNSLEGQCIVSQTADEDFIIGGFSLSDISGDKTEVSNGYNDYWVMKLTGNYNLIQGNTFADLNSNNINDGSEPSITYQKITETNTGRFNFTDFNGFYSLVVVDTGMYQIVPIDVPNYYSAAPINYNINFTSINQVDSLNDFAFQPTGSFNDLCLSITPNGPFRSGFNASYLINYSNIGTTTINATIVLYPDTNVSYVSASLSPLNITPDSVVFSIGNLAPFQTGQILVTVSVDAGIPIGSLINSSAVILPIAGDVNPGCNIAYWEVWTTGSFDPNDILVNRNFLYDYEIPIEPYLEYIIRFQNTGNDTAFMVKILNPIDTTRLQLNTLEIVNTSHPASISWIPWERNMQFQFDNILLPDSNINEPLSHGFIRYKIKPKTNLLVGDSIKNMAAIYFDYNIPVLTNSAKTDIILFTGNNELQNSAESFIVYPNPSSTQISIQFESSLSKYKSLELYSVVGQKIQSIDISDLSENHFVKSIDISKLPSGVYFLKFEGTSSFVKKFVKY